MTIKAWPRHHKVTSNLTIADKGQECRIDVSVGESRLTYGDSISIMTRAGTVRINGKHVHELMKSVLRFSSREMLETWIRFALLTNKAAGRRDIDLDTDYFDFDEWQVKEEKDSREWETKWNDNYFNKETELCN
jgi:hypothetical protein